MIIFLSSLLSIVNEHDSLVSFLPLFFNSRLHLEARPENSVYTEWGIHTINSRNSWNNPRNFEHIPASF